MKCLPVHVQIGCSIIVLLCLSHVSMVSLYTLVVVLLCGLCVVGLCTMALIGLYILCIVSLSILGVVSFIRLRLVRFSCLSFFRWCWIFGVLHVSLFPQLGRTVVCESIGNLGLVSVRGMAPQVPMHVGVVVAVVIATVTTPTLGLLHLAHLIVSGAVSLLRSHSCLWYGAILSVGL